MATIDDSDVPETGAVFTFGRSRFADNQANKFWIRNDRIVHLACGDEHSIIVTERGRLYSFGTNDWGQLGLGHTKGTNKPSFIKVLKPEKLVLAACGRTHSLVASESGKIFSFGAGGDGQLGHGSTEDQTNPKQIEGLPVEKVKILSCGVYHSAALFESGDLYTWGTGSDGQTGHEDEEILVPRILKFNRQVVWVACGYYHTAVVTDDGKLYTFGENECGKLGLAQSQLGDTSRPQPVACKDGCFVAVACGAGHTIALNDKGKVFSFGDGSRGQLGQGTRTQELSEPAEIQHLSHLNIKSISCGDCHSAVVSEHGRLFTFGDGRHGKLGQGEECFSNQFRPQKVARFEEFSVQSVSCGGCHMLVTAVKRTEENSDGNDEADGLLNASMASNYSHASIDAANATMRVPGLANTVPLISPRDKRRKKESENLANSFSGSFPVARRNDLPTINLDRSRLPPMPSLRDVKTGENADKNFTNEKSKENIRHQEEIVQDKAKEKSNSEKHLKDLELKQKLQNELDEDNNIVKNTEELKIQNAMQNNQGLPTLLKPKDVKGKLERDDKEEDDVSEEEEDGEEESDEEEEEEEETQAKKTDITAKKKISDKEAIKEEEKETVGSPKVTEEGEESEEEEETDEEDGSEEEEGEEEDDEEEEEEEDDEDGDEDDEDDDDDDEEEEEEDVKKVDKGEESTVQNDAKVQSNAEIKTEDTGEEKTKKNEKGKKKKKDKNENATAESEKTGKVEEQQTKNEEDDNEKSEENNNTENSGKSDADGNVKVNDENKQTNEKPSRFGGLFGRKKPQSPVPAATDAVDGPQGNAAQKKTGKSGVCIVL